jgi:putative hydrolase of the HAD superfamily
MIRAVLFDMGGTLLDFNPEHIPWPEWERAGLESACAYLSSRGYALSTEPFVDAFISAFIDSLPDRWERAGQGKGNLRLEDVMREACAACAGKPSQAEIDASIARCSAPSQAEIDASIARCSAPSQAEIDASIARYIAPLDARVVLYADTHDTLAALRARGLRMGLVSNTMWPGEYHRRELDRFGLTPYFQPTLFSADEGVWKPQPGIFQRALDALGVEAKEAVFVGDQPEYDVLGAQGVGMRGVYKHNGRAQATDVCPDAAIAHLSELLALIDLWNKADGLLD